MANFQGLIESAKNRDAQLEEVGIGGFTLLATVRRSFSLTSRAPVNYVEDGSNASDHIVLDPLVLTIEGNVSDIHIRPNPLIELQRRISSQIGVITKYLPLRTQSELSQINSIVNDATNAVRKVNAVIDDGRNAWEFFGNKDSESKGLVEQFIDFIESVHYGKQLINIEMPFRTHDNMRITSSTVDTDNQSNAISFAITAQKFRFFETELAELTDFFPAASIGIGGQDKGEKDKGTQTGEKQEQSLLSYLLGE